MVIWATSFVFCRSCSRFFQLLYHDMATTKTLRFGIEIELLVQPKAELIKAIADDDEYKESQDYYQLRKNRRAIYRALANVFSRNKIVMELDEGERVATGYLAWSIAYDGSIQERNPHDGFCQSTFLLA